jgi:hypothetical protein
MPSSVPGYLAWPRRSSINVGRQEADASAISRTPMAALRLDIRFSCISSSAGGLIGNEQIL